MQDKVLSLLGLARRAGKLAIGFEAAKAAVRNGSARLLAAAGDISEKTWKNLTFEGERAGTPVIRLTRTQAEISRACGIKTGVVSVLDEGFAKAITAAGPTEREQGGEARDDD